MITPTHKYVFQEKKGETSTLEIAQALKNHHHLSTVVPGILLVLCLSPCIFSFTTALSPCKVGKCLHETLT